MYYAITPDGVVPAKELKDFEKTGIKLDYDEFKIAGSDRVINLTEQDMDFVQDKKKISRLMLSQLYHTGQKQSNLYFYILIILTIISIIHG